MPTAQPNTEQDLVHYVAVLRRRRWVIALVMLVAVGTAAVLSILDTPQYQATTKVLVKNPPKNIGTTAGDPMTPRQLANELERANSKGVLTAVRSQVGEEPQLSASATRISDVFSFTAVSANASLAAVASQLHADTFLQDSLADVQAQNQAAIDLLQQRLDETEVRLADLQTQRQAAIDAVPADAADRTQQLADIQLQYDDDIQGAELQRQNYAAQLESQKAIAALAVTSGSQVIDAAVTPDSPTSPNLLRNLLLAFIASLIAGIALALILDHFDTKLIGEEQLTSVTGLGTLAGIPSLKGWARKGSARLISREDPQSLSAEAYRGLRTSLRFLSVDRQLQVLQFTSAVPGEGKTTTAANLAVVMARAGQRVVLLDCDLRRPRIHEFFELPNANGFTDLLLGNTTLDDVLTAVSGEDGLSVITSGPIPPDPSELLSSAKARELIDQLRGRVDLVVIDSPPVLAVTDPLVLAGLSDGTVLVASAGKSDTRLIGRAVDQLRQVEARLVGTVLNCLTTKGSSSYGYGYGYGYGKRSSYASDKVAKQPARSEVPAAEGVAPVADEVVAAEPAAPVTPPVKPKVDRVAELDAAIAESTAPLTGLALGNGSGGNGSGGNGSNGNGSSGNGHAAHGAPADVLPLDVAIPAAEAASTPTPADAADTTSGEPS